MLWSLNEYEIEMIWVLLSLLNTLLQTLFLLSWGFSPALTFLIVTIFLGFLLSRQPLKIAVNSLITIFIFAIFFVTSSQSNLDRERQPQLLPDGLYREHERYAQSSSGPYQAMVSDKIEQPFGDLYAIDGGNDPLRNLALSPRTVYFSTDKLGYRNSSSSILENNSVIFVGDSFVVGNGTSQEDIITQQFPSAPYNLGFPGGPADYWNRLNGLKHKIRQDAKIVLFFYEGNDFFRADDVEIGQLLTSILGQAKGGFLFQVHNAFRRTELGNYFFRTQKTLLLFWENRLGIQVNQNLFYAFESSFQSKGNSSTVFYEIDEKGNAVGYFIPDVYASISITPTTLGPVSLDDNLRKQVAGVVLIPTKFSTYHPEISDGNKLTSEYASSFTRSNFPNAKYVDLTKALRKQHRCYTSNPLSYALPYWNDDSHWNRYGILIAVQKLESEFNFRKQTKGKIKCVKK